jgi:cysteine desulfurase
VSDASIYLDHNSTTPIDPRVAEAMACAWKECGANPASQHSLGRKARRMLEEAREGILELLGAKIGGMDADQLIFTSGGTEANNLAILGLAYIASIGTKTGPGDPQRHPPTLFVSPIEHPSVTASAAEAQRRGCIQKPLFVNRDGEVEEIGSAGQLPFTAPGPSIVTVMLANNETGVIQPVDFLRKAEGGEANVGPLIHTDAVQAVGKIPVKFRELHVDAMTVAPHKFHGPLGIGALVLRHGVKLQTQMFGGFQQGGMRPGTENLALAVGFHAALKFAIDELTDRAARMKSLRDELEESLRAEFPEMVIIGEKAPRLPNTSCVSFPGLDRQALVMALDLAGVACSTGSACASGSSEPSPTLVAMGLPKPVIDGAIRLSLGTFTTAEEVAEAARRIIKTIKHLRSQK